MILKKFLHFLGNFVHILKIAANIKYRCPIPSKEVGLKKRILGYNYLSYSIKTGSNMAINIEVVTMKNIRA